jgi:Ca2+/Na+ antiporter
MAGLEGSLNLCSDGFELGYRLIGYAYILYLGANYIGDGSELLMLNPKIAPLVGPIVIPILGAVPDGLIMVFSGLGPQEQAQEKISVGVGALAGSTIMLLTLPWFMAVTAGRVNIVSGKADYANKTPATGLESIRTTGVQYLPEIKTAAVVMFITSLLFFVIQIPASIAEVKIPLFDSSGTLDENWTQVLRRGVFVSHWSLIGAILCAIFFVLYLLWAALAGSKTESQEYKDMMTVIDLIKKGHAGVETIVYHQALRKPSAAAQPLLRKGHKEFDQITKVIRPFFKKFDYNSNGTLEEPEMEALLKTLNSKIAAKDALKEGKTCLTLDEFVEFLVDYVQKQDEQGLTNIADSLKHPPGEDEDDEEDEVPEDLADAEHPAKQMRNIMFRACWQMALGTLVVVIFSDPMVDCLSDLGTITGVPAFYVSFLLAPLASNASELLCAFKNALKKTKVSISNGLSTLIGAACMNNTFCLCIFLFIVYFQGLAWEYTAETIAIMLVQWVIAAIAIMSETQTWLMSFVILSCYPGCLVIVKVLETMGLD